MSVNNYVTQRAITANAVQVLSVSRRVERHVG